MVKRSAYRIDYDPETVAHFAAIDLRDHRMIRREIEERAGHEPTVETRNRKPLVRPSALSPAWEIRCGPSNEYRIFYRVYEEDRAVLVTAVGVKVRNRLIIGGKAVRI